MANWRHFLETALRSKAPASDILRLKIEMPRSNATRRKMRLMPQKLRLTTFQIGVPAQRGQGLRIGVTRRPPRGVHKSRWRADGYFDVWLPALALSAKLISAAKSYDFDNAAQRANFFTRNEHEILSSAESRQTVDFVAEIAARIPIGIGCFCADESRCHRSHLYKILQKHAPNS